MRIRYQPARSTPEIEIRDLRGHKHGVWRRGEEQDFADDETASFREANGQIVVKKITDAIFSCGPDFVDVATGVNPFFACAACGAPATDDFFVHPNTLVPHYIRMDQNVSTSPRLCMTDFLARHPEHVARFKNAGLSLDVIAEAKKRSENPPTAPALAVDSAPAAPAPVDTPVQASSDAPVDTPSPLDAPAADASPAESSSFGDEHHDDEHHDDEGHD